MPQENTEISWAKLVPSQGRRGRSSRCHPRPKGLQRNNPRQRNSKTKLSDSGKIPDHEIIVQTADSRASPWLPLFVQFLQLLHTRQVFLIRQPTKQSWAIKSAIVVVVYLLLRFQLLGQTVKGQTRSLVGSERGGDNKGGRAPQRKERLPPPLSPRARPNIHIQTNPNTSGFQLAVNQRGVALIPPYNSCVPDRLWPVRSGVGEMRYDVSPLCVPRLCGRKRRHVTRPPCHGSMCPWAEDILNSSGVYNAIRSSTSIRQKILR